jgi:hypothetical protein
MMKRDDPRIAWTAAIREPERTAAWTLTDWEVVVRLARRLRLLARLAQSLDAAGLLERVPEAPRCHLAAEWQVSRFRTAALVWALQCIHSTLGSPSYPCVLLKGAAYEGQGLPIAHGRLPSDVDVLVPRAHLDAFQRALVADGWQEAVLDAHDQRYYREYSHELPPMRHPLHTIELDVHHDILPPVASTRVDIALMIERVQPSVWPGWQVLQPTDQVLHSAAHLFLDSQARDRLRDLIDLDGLLRHFGGGRRAFFDELVARAGELGLTRPLALAVHFCVEWLDTPIPSPVRQGLKPHLPSGVQRWWLMPTLAALLWPAHPDEAPPRSQRVAATLFLARYHAERMPLRLLVPHLLHKLRARPATPEPPPDVAGGV